MTNFPIKKPELLLPAGDFEKAKFAIAFGADAIYLGIPKFSLRARENGFHTIKDVAETIHWVQSQHKKAYVTANIFAHHHKVSTFVQDIKKILDICQPDAWIMSDPGLIMLMRENFPSQTIHLSVQSNVMNAASALFWYKQGIKRIILSREITIQEMHTIHITCPNLELECFVHGSICIAYSGRCLISNYLAHRDSNQGLCTHSCRWQYKLLHSANNEPSSQKDYRPLSGSFFLEESLRKEDLLPIDEDENGSYIMNAKDLCAIELLEDLLHAGIHAFKIEGRSKTLYYVSMMARAYRQAIDKVLQQQPIDQTIVNEIYSTSSRGFTKGFLQGDLKDTAIEYHQNSSVYQQYRFTGIVKDYQHQRLIVETRNPICVGKTYELCTPKENISFQVKDLFDEKGRPINIIHGGLHQCQFSYPTHPGAFALIRESIKNGSDSL